MAFLLHGTCFIFADVMVGHDVDVMADAIPFKYHRAAEDGSCLRILERLKNSGSAVKTPQLQEVLEIFVCVRVSLG